MGAQRGPKDAHFTLTISRERREDYWERKTYRENNREHGAYREVYREHKGLKSWRHLRAWRREDLAKIQRGLKTFWRKRIHQGAKPFEGKKDPWETTGFQDPLRQRDLET